MGAWQWLLDLLVAALLVATLLRAGQLDRALTALRRDRSELEALLGGFETSTQQATGVLQKLREMSDGAGRRVEQQTGAAVALRDDLALLIERGEQLLDRLDHAVRAGWAAAPQERLAASDRLAVGSPRQAAAVALLPSVAAPGDLRRVRSKAERDLLMALQAGR